MSMEICRACGSFLMPTWERCRICGAERGSPTGPAEVAPAPDPPRTPATTRMAMLTVAVAIIALYIGWYLPTRDGGGGPVEEAAATSTTTKPPATSTTAAGGTTTTTTAGGTTTTSTTLSPSDLRLVFAVAITQLASEAYPADDDAWPCAGLLTVDAVGGPSAIQERGLEPSDFAGGQVGGRLQATDESLDRIADGLPGCGIDMVELLAAQLASTAEPDVVTCIEDELDRDVANAALALQLTGDTDAMSPESPLFEAVVSASETCAG